MRYLIFLRLSPKITMTWKMPRIGWLFADRWNIFQLLFLGCQMTIVILQGHCGWFVYTSHRMWSYLYSILYIVSWGCSASVAWEAKKIQKWRDFGGQWFNYSSVQQRAGTVYSGVVCNPPFLIKPPPFTLSRVRQFWLVIVTNVLIVTYHLCISREWCQCTIWLLTDLKDKLRLSWLLVQNSLWRDQLIPNSLNYYYFIHNWSKL
jgi:hypothetical protein